MGTAIDTINLEYCVGKRNISCSGEMLRYDRTPIAKAAYYAVIDTEARKRGDQTGLDTLVVHALNYGYSTSAIHC